MKQSDSFAENRNREYIAEYVLNKTSIYVFVNSCNAFMKCVMNRSFLCCPTTSVDTIVTQQ